jgi:hypothetical protein
MSAGAMARHLPSRRRVRRLLLRRLRGLAGLAYRRARAVPLPARVRRALYQTLPWRPGTREVSLDRILLGGQNRVSATAYAEATDDLLWPSTRIADGPHAELFRSGTAAVVDSVGFAATRYARMARACIDLSGQYFGAHDEAGVLQVARESVLADAAEQRPRRPHQSAPDAPVLLAPVRDSDCFQVIDGHHRLARLAVSGGDRVRARVKRLPVSTPLQDLLDDMSWIGGERELYQPLDAPEVAQSWRTVRGCTDRFEAMVATTDELGLVPDRSSYLDVASCYGWFVAHMARRGFDATGIELDPRTRRLAAAAYGIEPEQIRVGDAVEFLADSGRTWDVVSCFSLLHHFALGRGRVGPEELVRLLDRVTARVLFLDTGQAHESWFRTSLPEWDTAYVARFLAEHGTFDDVVDLGPDHDGVPPYEGNYGRHLFACVRDVQASPSSARPSHA